MTPAEIPAQLRELLDQAAGKTHSDEGPVMACLANILTTHEATVRTKIAADLERLADNTWRDHDSREMARSNGIIHAANLVRGNVGRGDR